jgi:cytochrome c-type biogenesis protein CcmH
MGECLPPVAGYRAQRALWLTAFLLMPLALFANTKEAAPASSDPAIEARMQHIANELRCLVCQNQTIADSNADLAADLREQVRGLLRSGQSDEQIIKYMTDRYGDFVLYRPPVKATTWLLWFGPGVLVLGGLAALLLVLRRRNRLPDERFEPDEDDGANAAASDVASPEVRSTT